MPQRRRRTCFLPLFESPLTLQLTLTLGLLATKQLGRLGLSLRIGFLRLALSLRIALAIAGFARQLRIFLGPPRLDALRFTLTSLDRREIAKALIGFHLDPIQSGVELALPGGNTFETARNQNPLVTRDLLSHEIGTVCLPCLTN